MNRRAFTLATVVIVTIVSLGASAYAYWSTAGSGTATGSTGTLLVNLVALAGGDTPSSTLLPGDTAQLLMKVSNPNSYDITLISVGPKSGSSVSNACGTTGVSVVPQSNLNIPLPHGATTTVEVPGAVQMDTSSVSACQGATLSVPVTITVQK